MVNRRFVAYAGIVFVMVAWGLSFLSIKVAMRVLGPMSLATIRFVIASVLLTAFLKLKEPGARLLKKDFWLMALSGIVGISVYFFFENNGINLTTASTASIIIGTIPILTVISDYIFCGNKITWPKGIGVVLSFFGVYLIVRNSGGLSLSSKDFVGNLLMLGAALAWVLYSLLTRPLGERYSQLAITTYQTLFGTAAMVPFAFLETNSWNLLDWSIIGNVLFLAVFCSALGYFFYVYALGELGVGVSSLFINLIPVVTLIGSYFILGEKITSSQLLGGGLIIGSVYLADLSSWLKGEHDKAASIDL